jgi:hypothetical protein
MLGGVQGRAMGSGESMVLLYRRGCHMLLLLRRKYCTRLLHGYGMLESKICDMRPRGGWMSGVKRCARAKVGRLPVTSSCTLALLEPSSVEGLVLGGRGGAASDRKQVGTKESAAVRLAGQCSILASIIDDFCLRPSHTICTTEQTLATASLAAHPKYGTTGMSCGLVLSSSTV